MPQAPKTQVAIIGGGLSGLCLADYLNRKGVDYQLFEAADTFGGRVKTGQHDGAEFDLGPSWFWPGQPRMAALARRFDLQVFDQFSDGDLLFEDATGHVHRGQGHASMAGSLRIAGGMNAMIKALETALPKDRLHLNAMAEKLSQRPKPNVVFADERNIEADQIVVGLPPRKVADLTVSPRFPEPVRRLLQQIPTWMAGHAKLVAVYDQPFWRAGGFSGDAISQRGPLVEIHDASAMSGTPAALFGFFGTPAPQRLADPQGLEHAAVAQLGRLFGPQALKPTKVFLQDWAGNSLIANEDDQTPPASHPSYGLPSDLKGLWNGKLVLGSSEAATDHGGFLEGALARAEEVFHLITQTEKV